MTTRFEAMCIINSAAVAAFPGLIDLIKDQPRPAIQLPLLVARWTFTPLDHGSVLLVYARVTDIVLGVIIVLFFDMIFPWCVTRACRSAWLSHLHYCPLLLAHQ